MAITHDGMGGSKSRGDADRHDARFAAALGRARRHSRFVRFARVGLPVLAVATVAGFGAATWVRSVVPENLALDSLKVEDGELVMTNPRLRGFDERDQPYSVDATRATQSVADPDRFELEEVLADLPLRDGRRVTVLSGGGAYDRGEDRLEIPDPFTITVDDGTTARVKGGTVDIGEGTFQARGAVDLERPGARIEAEAMRIERDGRSATFTGGVRVTIEPGSPMAPPTLREGTSQNDQGAPGAND